MTLSQANAGALVRAILDAVDTAVDPLDCSDEDLEEACKLLEKLAAPRLLSNDARVACGGGTIQALAATLRGIRRVPERKGAQ